MTNVESAESPEVGHINLQPGLQFRFRTPMLVGKAGMHELPAPDCMGEPVEYSTFFYNPEGGVGRDSLGELEVTNSSLIVLGKFDKRVVCRFMPIVSEGVRTMMGHQHHLLAITFHSPFRNYMLRKEIEVMRQLQLSYTLSFRDPKTEEQLELAKWLAKT